MHLGVSSYLPEAGRSRDIAGEGVRLGPASTRSAIAIRPFTTGDEPQVLELLDVALGGGPAGRRPPELFRWKHLANPFGSSFMLVAEADGRLVGLRAFMRWRFTAGDRVLRAVRAVDTATHPDYQGRGVFSLLTRAALDALEGQVDLVFNTPNGKSGPGYLKLGWREVGRVPVRVRVRRPVRLLAARRGVGRPAPAVRAVPAATALADTDAIGRLLRREPTPRGLATPRDPVYLAWRYGAAPLLGYRAVTEERGGELTGVAIFRVRPRGALWESTVAEVHAGGDPGTARRLLRKVVRSAPVDHLTLHAPGGSPLAGAATMAGFVATPAGVSLVVNPRRDGIRPDPTDLRAWSLSLGDLEVF
jgi:GNAT superfamily N-acetyltransferase